MDGSGGARTLGSSMDSGLNRVPRDGPPTCACELSLRVASQGAQQEHTRITALVEPLLARDGLLDRSDREGACRLILAGEGVQAEGL